MAQRGDEHGEGAELAVVVMSYGNDATIVAAVESLLAQDVPLEIVVSHSGGGDTPRLLAAAHPGVPVIASGRRRLPGEARNAGLAATRAPWVAFLEGDSLAQPGWAAARLARHRAGELAVAGAILPGSLAPAALAAHLQRNSLRMPHMPAPKPHVRYMVSFSRALLERLGPFPEGLARSEDTVMNTRVIEAGVEIAWAPEVLLLTTYPRDARELWREQYRRGRIWGSVTGGLAWRLAGAFQSLGDGVAGVMRGLRRGSPLARQALLRALPHVALCALATAAGRARGGPAPAAQELAAANAARAARLDYVRRRLLARR